MMRRKLFLSLALPIVMHGAPAARAQEIPADEVLKGFVPTGEYVLQVEGKADPEAEVFLAERAGMVLLVDSAELPDPVLLSPRKQRAVESVSEQKVVDREDGSRDVLSDAELKREGSFRVAGGAITFDVGGRQFALEEAPYALGPVTAEQLREKDPGYEYRARTYQLSRPMLARLEKVGEPATVKVFFGSWCPFCRHHVPKALRLAEELQGSPVRFEFYGLPRAFGDDPAAAQWNVTGVPTGIVLRGGKEIGRINGSQWNIPELAIQKILAE